MLINLVFVEPNIIPYCQADDRRRFLSKYPKLVFVTQTFLHKYL